MNIVMGQDKEIKVYTGMIKDHTSKQMGKDELLKDICVMIGYLKNR